MWYTTFAKYPEKPRRLSSKGIENLHLFICLTNMKGTIKSIIAEKHFGFITPDAEEHEPKDVFFHESGLAEGIQFASLKIGDVVTFEKEDSDKGPRAVGIVLA